MDDATKPACLSWVQMTKIRLEHRRPKLTLREWNVIYFPTRESVSRYRRALKRCIEYHYILPLRLPLKVDYPFMYSCVFSCEFIDLVDFLAPLCDPCHSIHNTKSRLHRPQYVISHTTSQRSPVTQHRLSCEKVIYETWATSSETQGQIVGARESLNGRKNMARRKVKNGEKSPWGQCLVRPVPNGRRRSGFWLVPEKHKFSGTNQKPERQKLILHSLESIFLHMFIF